MLTAADGDDGVVEGRFGFLDLLYEGRWGGLITGDKVTVDFKPRCPCGRPGPTLLDNITRFAQVGRGRPHRLRRHHRRLHPRSDRTHDDLPPCNRRRSAPTGRCRCAMSSRARRSFGTELEYGPARSRFATPALDLDELVWPRREPGPAFDVPLAEIIDVLVATGDRLTRDPDGLLAEALEHSARTSPLPREVLERSFAASAASSTAASMEFQVQQELGGADVLDGWREVTARPSGRRHRIRAFPPRLIHVIAGNAPGVAAHVGDARRADQGRAPAQAAVQRPVLAPRRSCARWPRSRRIIR